MNEDVLLIRNFLEDSFARESFDYLLSSIAWKNILKTNEGIEKKINRKMSYVYEKKIIYKYAGLNLEGETWNDRLLAIRDKIKTVTGYDTNSVLLNFYETGKDEIRWHSDKEEILGNNPVIPMVNLGASRTFWFKNKASGENTNYVLNNGDLLVMLENCQTNWLHAILKEKDVKDGRISLTYRKVSE